LTAPASDFTNLVPPEEADKILERLIAQAPPEKRQELESEISSKTTEERRRLAQVYIRDDDWRGDVVHGRQRL
jgi:hypothetical protein